MTSIDRMELEIECERMVYKLEAYSEQKRYLTSKIRELEKELVVCNDEINELGAKLMAASLKLAKMEEVK